MEDGSWVGNISNVEMRWENKPWYRVTQAVKTVRNRRYGRRKEEIWEQVKLTDHICIGTICHQKKATGGALGLYKGGYHTQSRELLREHNEATCQQLLQHEAALSCIRHHQRLSQVHKQKCVLPLNKCWLRTNTFPERGYWLQHQHLLMPAGRGPDARLRHIVKHIM